MKKSIISLSTLVIIAAVIFTGLNWAQANPPEIIGHQLDDEISPPPQTSQADLFLSIEGIPGESTDPDHEEWIDVLSYAHAMGDHGTMSGGSGGGGGSSSTVHHDFSITKAIDKATPLLAIHLNKGQHIPEVKFDICTGSATKRICKMKYKLQNVMITSVMHGGSSYGGSLPPTEEVTFAYERITWEYTEIDDKGKPLGTIEKCWDVVSNTEC